ELSHQVFFLDISEPLEPRIVGSVDVGPQPFDPIYSLDGRYVFVGNKAANTVTVIDAQARRVERVNTGAGLAQPHGVALSPDGRHLYVSNNNLRAAHDMGGGGDHAAHMAAAAPQGPASV